jgi:hypothetical protein
VAITRKHLHMATEAMAILITVPAALALARTTGPLTKKQKAALRRYAWATLVIDGYFLAQWFRKNGKDAT